MIQCPNCRILHPINTLYCNECGEYLGENKKDTQAFMSDVSDVPLFSEDRFDGFEPGAVASSPSEITFLVGQPERRISVSLRNEVLLGRVDPTSNNYPDVDLTEYGGIKQGVSRRHARILCRQNDVVVEDLGSINGSFVNGKPLTPYLAHPLRSGDLLRLGKLKVKIIL